MTRSASCCGVKPPGCRVEVVSFERSTAGELVKAADQYIPIQGQYASTWRRDPDKAGAGTLVDTGGLLPSKDGARVRLANGKITVTDGPFSESKEIIGGFFLIDCATKEQAVAIALRESLID